MIMTQQEFIASVPRYDFRISIIDTKTMQEKQIGHQTDELDEIIYEFGDMVTAIEADTYQR
jgi:hypothetical protein